MPNQYKLKKNKNFDLFFMKNSQFSNLNFSYFDTQKF